MVRRATACQGLLVSALAVAGGVYAAPSPEAVAPADAEGVAFFEQRIRPVLVARCYSCHSDEAKKIKGGLRVDTKEGLRTGGQEGPAVVPGDPKSLLLRAIRYTDEEFQMPPEPENRLTAAEVQDFETWIARGAPDPRVGPALAAAPVRDLAAARAAWPFSPLTSPAVPAVKNTGWPKTPVDAFVLARLEDKGLAPIGDADKQTLLRRATFDLIGLPPTPEEIAAFLADRRPNAFAKVVDRLLGSPRYGERWGRHWLDVVRYADTAGDNGDFPIPQMYKYRNWVIAAFNRDQPYDQFVGDQIAGDLLPAKTQQDRFQKIIATGYIANARRFGSRVSDYPQHLTIEDTIDNLGRAFLGLSVSCARCHDHKFDPVSTEDYYALYGIFHSTRYPWPGIELQKYQRDLVPLAAGAKPEQILRDRAARLAPLETEITRLEAEKVIADAKLAAEAARPGGDATAAVAEVRKLKKQLENLGNQKQKIFREPLPFETAYAVAEGAQSSHVKVQIKGDPTKTGREVPRGFLQVLGGQHLPSGETGSGRRALARWLVAPENPLAARVMVNRIWLYHFGKGLVQTPNDFGKQGKPPTHPELLDHLARRFIASGWSVKAMHRLIMLSRTYQLASGADGAIATRNAATDPTNDLLWRWNRQRLDAEEIRDTLLAVSGGLDTAVAQAHPFPPQSQWDFTQHKPFRGSYETNHRSVYMMTQRTTRDPYLAVFDGADPNGSTPMRLTSTTPLQALFLMNAPFVHEQAQRFAARLLRDAPDDARRLERAYLLAFGRPITPSERDTALQHLDATATLLGRQGIAPETRGRQAWESIARALFQTSELVYLR